MTENFNNYFDIFQVQNGQNGILVLISLAIQISASLLFPLRAFRQNSPQTKKAFAFTRWSWYYLYLNIIIIYLYHLFDLRPQTDPWHKGMERGTGLQYHAMKVKQNLVEITPRSENWYITSKLLGHTERKRQAYFSSWACLAPSK